MLKWIGLEESLFRVEIEQDHLKRFIQQAENMGLKVMKVRDIDFCQLLENHRLMSEGVLIINGRQGSLKGFVGKLPVIGFDNRYDTAKEELSVEKTHIESYSMMPEGIRYIIESFEGVEPAYLQMVYHRFYHIPMIVAETKRGILREITTEDVSVLWERGITLRTGNGATYKVPENSKLMDWKQNESLWKEEQEFVQAYVSNMYEFYNYGMWIFQKLESNKENQTAICGDSLTQEAVLGIAGFDHIEPEELPEESLLRHIAKEHFCLQVGYHICYNYRRQGYGLEALQTVVKYGFESIEVDEIVLLIAPDNFPSIKLAKKAGFAYLESTIYQGTPVEVYGVRATYNFELA